MSVSVTLKSYFYEVLIPSSQKNTSSPIEDILHHVSISFMKKLALYKCFNPRTHTGCDYRNAIENGASEVSIHAPTRGATYRHLRRQRGDPVSIHAPTRGATLLATVSLLEHRHRFNPRTHTGCDLFTHLIIVLICSFQSTHPHGVRRKTYSAPTPASSWFQSTHPHGVRPHIPANTAYAAWFQSTHPHGVRLFKSGHYFFCAPSFNPRTHTGCDIAKSMESISSNVSIHAPTRGATTARYDHII